ncbi:fimbrial protein [Enterobacteriaceae bacterium RIT711]|nr:fimbrial protein [Enterobacteriaceae bacterium RIT711]
MTFIRLIFIVFSLLFVAQQATAALSCTYTPAGPSVINFPLPTTLTIIPNLAVGQVLWQSSVVGSQSLQTYCNQNWYAVTGYSKSVVPGDTAVAGVYKTNVPGIGVQVLGYGSALPKPGTVTNYAYYPPYFPGSFLALQVKLIKTGPISAGQLSFPDTQLGGGYASESSTTLVNEFPYGLANVTGSTNIVLPTCSISAVSVDMGSLSVNEFRGIGHTARATHFDISIKDCPTGWKQVSYQFMPVTSALTTNGVIALTGSSTATGVGIQITDDNGTPLTAATGFNAFAPLGTLPRSKAYNTAVGGSFILPLAARYYQTATAVTPGTANSTVIFTTGYD